MKVLFPGSGMALPHHPQWRTASPICTFFADIPPDPQHPHPISHNSLLESVDHCVVLQSLSSLSASHWTTDSVQWLSFYFQWLVQCLSITLFVNRQQKKCFTKARDFFFSNFTCFKTIFSSQFCLTFPEGPSPLGP